MKLPLHLTIIAILTFSHSITHALPLTEVASNYIKEKYSIEQTEQQITFSQEGIHQSGKYAVIASPTFFADGTTTDYFIEDVSFVLCLMQVPEWTVVYDLSRTDVPNQEELQDIRKKFPSDFPTEILPQFWKNLLNKEENKIAQ